MKRFQVKNCQNTKKKLGQKLVKKIGEIGEKLVKLVTENNEK